MRPRCLAHAPVPTPRYAAELTNRTAGAQALATLSVTMMFVESKPPTMTLSGGSRFYVRTVQVREAVPRPSPCKLGRSLASSCVMVSRR